MHVFLLSSCPRLLLRHRLSFAITPSLVPFPWCIRPFSFLCNPAPTFNRVLSTVPCHRFPSSRSDPLPHDAHPLRFGYQSGWCRRRLERWIGHMRTDWATPALSPPISPTTCSAALRWRKKSSSALACMLACLCRCLGVRVSRMCGLRACVRMSVFGRSCVACVAACCKCARVAHCQCTCVWCLVIATCSSELRGRTHDGVTGDCLNILCP